MTALSVLSAIVSGTALSIAAEMMFCAPMMFVWMASNGLYSQAGTCLSAAAWTITSTPRLATFRRSPSRTSPSSQRSRESWSEFCSSDCLSSSRLNTRIECTSWRASTVRMKAVPNDPVPPVTSRVFPLRSITTRESSRGRRAAFVTAKARWTEGRWEPCMSLEVALSRMAQLQSMFAAPAVTQAPAPTTTPPPQQHELRVAAADRRAPRP